MMQIIQKKQWLENRLMIAGGPHKSVTLVTSVIRLPALRTGEYQFV